MALQLVTRTLDDGVGGTFDLFLVKDTVTGKFYEAGAILGPDSGQWAKVGAVDQRLATSQAAAVPTVVGSQYNLTVGSGANVLLTVPAGATHAYITVDPNSAGNYLRYTFDGSNPSGTVGHTLAPADADWFTNLAVVEFSGDGGAMTIHVTFFKF